MVKTPEQEKPHQVFLSQDEEEEEAPKESPEPVDDLFEPLTPDKSPTDLFMSDEDDLEQVRTSIGSLFRRGGRVKTRHYSCSARRNSSILKEICQTEHEYYKYAHTPN